MTEVLLCHFDGTSGSTTFTDSSPIGRTLTSTLGAAVETSQVKFGTGAANLTVATNNNISVGGSLSDFEFGSSPFTIECWAYANSTLNVNSLLSRYNSSDGWFFGCIFGPLAFWYMDSSNTLQQFASSTTPSLNTWHFYTADRDSGGTLRIYIDGVVVASTSAVTFHSSTETPLIGNDATTARAWPGFIDEMRVTNGLALYGGAFTPPTAPFPNPSTSVNLTGASATTNAGTLTPADLIEHVNLTGAAATTSAGSVTTGLSTITPLTVSINQSYAGFDWKDNRTVFYDLTNITLGSGGFSGSQWYTDAGPIGMNIAELEPRAFCLQGQASFSFLGTELIVRLNVAFSWFTGATVTIDGVAPSTLGLSTYTNTLSCDSATYGLDSDSYVDVVVANGLTSAVHNVVITIDSTNPAQFFSIVGYKVGSAISLPIERDGAWLVATSELLSQNMTTISVTNNTTEYVVNPTLTFPAGLVTSTDTTLSTLTVAQLGPSESIAQIVLSAYTGNEVSGQFPYALGLSGEYYDPAGLITATITATALVGDPTWTVTGTWFIDDLTPTNQQRIYTDTFGTAYIAATFQGDALQVTVQSETGFGNIGMYASDNSTLLYTITDDTGAGTLVTTSYSGFGAGPHTVYFKKIANDGLFIVLVATAWDVTSTYTLVSETVTMNYESQQPYAMPVIDLQVSGLNVTFDAPILSTTDYVDTPVRENTYLSYTEVLSRFPTYAVCYLAGYTDILSQYDRLIVDPLAVHAADVIAWQAMGIKVYGYISSGEEVGTYANRYDFGTALAPWPGAGPGGYAAYYMFTQHPSAGPPDQDGVWSSYYINPDPAFGWPARVESYYIPQCIGGPVTISNEVVTTKTVTITAGSVIVFDTANSPIDIDQPITLTTLGATHTYVEYQDFTFDPKTGAFVLSTTISPAVTSGQQLLVSYTRKGHNMDGIFWDTVDTPDVYGGLLPPFPVVSGYAALYTTMFNTWKSNNAAVPFISNRGFTILSNIIQSCAGVMFESWQTLPTTPDNLTITGYALITDPATVATNQGFDQLLRDLRQTNVFDVYSLNYVTTGDTSLQLYCREQDAERGYLSWQSTITLTSPGANSTIKTTGVPPANSVIGTPLFPITTNAYTRVSITPVGGV